MHRTYLTRNEIAVNSIADAESIMEILIDNGYCVMVSKEENLFIVNYVWSENHSDRNDVCFNYREIIEDIIFNNNDEKVLDND
jgi:hypothetical protein